MLGPKIDSSQYSPFESAERRAQKMMEMEVLDARALREGC